MKVRTLDDVLIPQIAAQLKLNHDGHGDTRLFYDQERITVFASDMSKTEYNAMEKDINSFLIKGKGFEVYAWNDCSGYEYWSRDKNESNYIQITANISNAKKVNLNELKDAINKAFDHFYGYDNTDCHNFNENE